MITRKEHGWAGHFVGASHCSFRRNTHVSDGERTIVISTVGNYQSSPNNRYPVPIGYKKLYETYLFCGIQQGPYIEADVQKQRYVPVECGIYCNGDEFPLDIDLKADEIHEGVVAYVMEHFDEVSKG